jgi:hypothetical protein
MSSISKAQPFGAINRTLRNVGAELVCNSGFGGGSSISTGRNGTGFVAFDEADGACGVVLEEFVAEVFGDPGRKASEASR